MGTQKVQNSNLATATQQVNLPSQTRTMRSVEMYSGPIPPASELAKYESVLPGAADRILTMAEKQSQHRQRMEDTMLDANIKSERNGQIFGFIIFSITIIVGFILLMFGRNIEGLISLVIAIGGIIGLFIYNRKEVRKELKEKDRLVRRQ